MSSGIPDHFAGSPYPPKSPGWRKLLLPSTTSLDQWNPVRACITSIMDSSPFRETQEKPDRRHRWRLWPVYLYPKGRGKPSIHAFWNNDLDGKRHSVVYPHAEQLLALMCGRERRRIYRLRSASWPRSIGGLDEQNVLSVRFVHHYRPTSPADTRSEFTEYLRWVGRLVSWS